MYAKCICRVPDLSNWTVIHITGRDRVIRCSACRQAWHTTASYAEELPVDPVSPYEWRQLIRTPEYHKGEGMIEGEEDGYLDSARPSIFAKEDPNP